MTYPKIQVLDKGHVELIDYRASDHFICEAARISTGATSVDPEKDRKLIHRLWKDQHTSPFETCVFWFKIKLPIFVMRELVRHRTARLNEMSGRYRELPHEAYIPTTDRLQPQSKANKQGSEAGELINTDWTDYFIQGDVHHYRGHPKKVVTQDLIKNFLLEKMKDEQEFAFDNYEHYLETSLSRELARINLPVSTYTEIIWQMDLRNLLHFLKLRMAPDAQWEIRQYANAIYDLIKPVVPYTIEAFEEYTLHSYTLSREEKVIIIDSISEFLEEGGWNYDKEDEEKIKISHQNKNEQLRLLLTKLL